MKSTFNHTLRSKW